MATKKEKEIIEKLKDAVINYSHLTTTDPIFIYTKELIKEVYK